MPRYCANTLDKLNPVIFIPSEGRLDRENLSVHRTRYDNINIIKFVSLMLSRMLNSISVTLF